MGSCAPQPRIHSGTSYLRSWGAHRRPGVGATYRSKEAGVDDGLLVFAPDNAKRPCVGAPIACVDHARHARPVVSATSPTWTVTMYSSSPNPRTPRPVVVGSPGGCWHRGLVLRHLLQCRVTRHRWLVIDKHCDFCSLRKNLAFPRWVLDGPCLR